MSPAEQVNAGARPRGEATEAAAAEQVREIFDAIAPSYDLLNHLLSMGLDRRWWWRAAGTFRDVLARPNARVLDLCCGTGDMTAALLKQRPSSAEPVMGLDFSGEMLERARVKYATANAVWVKGDAMHLPYAEGTFDLVTAAFGFRNLTNYAEGLAEIYRVLAPGGRVGILECNQPDGWRGRGYGIYFQHVLPVLGGLISGKPAAYRYLPDSVMRFPRPKQMLGMMREAGFTDAAWDGYLLQAAGLYRGVK
ncbi:MAG: bifunctional demethylmenaquinone methyltransferase/2-methoxy-6-polyprenyl-1,4-benzoquinol methylase UbiE [Acidobacteriaceae bacterium]